MKLVALALALFLAVGSQAAAVPDHSTLDHIRGGMRMSLKTFLDAVKTASDAALEGTDYMHLKPQIAERLNGLYDRAVTFQEAAAPVTNGVIDTLADITAAYREAMMADVADLRQKLEEKNTELKTNFDRHLESYKNKFHEKVAPLLQEIHTKYEEMMAPMRERITPVVGEVSELGRQNVEETKAILQPMAEDVYQFVAKQIRAAAEGVRPYVEEYIDQAKKGYARHQAMTPEQMQAIQESLRPHIEAIKTSFTHIANILASALNQD